MFRLGSRTKVLSLPNVNITDGKTHIVKVERVGNYATLQVDYAGKVEGSTGGSSNLMNFGGGALFSGGTRRLTAMLVMRAIVKSNGKAIVQTADGGLISTFTSFSGSLYGVSLITIGKKGGVTVKILKNATLIRMYQKHRIRSVYNSSAGKVVLGNAGVSVSEIRVSNSSAQSVHRILQRRNQQSSGDPRAKAGPGANAVVTGGKLSSVADYGSRLKLRQSTEGKRNRSDVDESYAG